MTRRTLTLAAVALAGALMTPIMVHDGRAFAQDKDVCLQNNRIWSWRAIDQRTLVVTDIYNRPFLVRLTGGCVGLTNAMVALQFRTWTNLGCLGQGDRVSFREPTLGQMSCIVRQVQAYAPGPDEHYYSRFGEGKSD